MAKKKVGLWIEKSVSDDLDDLAERGLGKGEIAEAALRLFFRSSAQQKRAALREAIGATIDSVIIEAGERGEGDASAGKKILDSAQAHEKQNPPAKDGKGVRPPKAG